jgi:hypothetical protein
VVKLQVPDETGMFRLHQQEVRRFLIKLWVSDL